MSDDDEYEYVEEDEAEEEGDMMASAPQNHRQGSVPLSATVGSRAYGFPTGVSPLMGESMCASDPSSFLNSQTIRPGQKRQQQQNRRQADQNRGYRGREIPVTGIVNGPANSDPVPFDERGASAGVPVGQVTSSYGYANEMARPMSNVPIWQTPITPFSKSRDTSPYDVEQSSFRLYQAQGYGRDPDAWRPKREQGPMFKPQPQNIFGMPAQAQVQRDRYQPSNELRHQKPFEAEWSLRTGNFHPTTRILPTFTPVLRQQLAQNYVAGPSFATSHPSGLYGEDRGELGLVERKGADLSFYYHVPFPTSFVNDAPMMHAKIVDRPTARQNSNIVYGGQVNAAGTIGGAIYLPGKVLLHDQRLPSQEHYRFQVAGAPHLVGGGATQSHFMDLGRATMKEATEYKTSVANIQAPVPSGMVPFQDIARATMLEATEHNVRQGALSTGNWGLAPTMQFMDQAKPTMLEATEGMVRMANGNWALAPTMQFMDQAKPTMLEATEGMVRMANGNWMLAPTMQFVDQAKPTMLEATENSFRQANGNWSLAPTMQFMDSARPTMLEATEMAGANSVTNAQAGGQFAPMTYNMDPARQTLKQFTSDHDYTGIAGSAANEAAMSTYAYTQNAILNDKLGIATSACRAPNQGPSSTIGTQLPL